MQRFAAIRCVEIILATSALGEKLTIVSRNVTSLSPFTFRSGEGGLIDEVGQELVPAWPIDGHHFGRPALQSPGDAALAQLGGRAALQPGEGQLMAEWCPC